MQTDVFLLADYAHLAEGKLYISGGGWSRLTVERFPYRRRIGLAIGLRLAPDESGTRHSFRVNMQTPGDPIELGYGQFESVAFEGPSQVFLVAINADLAIESEGQYELVLSFNDNEVNRIGFVVVLAS